MHNASDVLRETFFRSGIFLHFSSVKALKENTLQLS